jgi:hypothetical protein
MFQPSVIIHTYAICSNRLSLYVQGARSMTYNPAENAVLINTDAEGGSYELFMIPKDAGNNRAEPQVTVDAVSNLPLHIHAHMRKFSLEQKGTLAG